MVAHLLHHEQGFCVLFKNNSLDQTYEEQTEIEMNGLEVIQEWDDPLDTTVVRKSGTQGALIATTVLQVKPGEEKFL